MSGIRERLASLSRDRLALLVLELSERLEAQAQPYTPIAIVGMACRFPGGVSDAASYWNLLRQCTDAIREVPKDRWDIDSIYDPNPEATGKTYCRHGGFLDAIDSFDADFFGLSPREAISMDPQQRLLLEVAWEALEDAGIAADRLAGSSTGVFIGAGANDYSRLLSDPATVDGYGLTGNALNALAGRISFVLGLRGPSLVVDTACSSSLVAVHLAALSLRCGESRAALAGGVNLMLVPYPTVITSRLRMLAPDGRCKAFDAAADGFVRSEGCGVIVLKRLEDAQQDGDRILAVIKGSGVNQDGASSGFTVPNVLSQKALIQDSLRRAGVTPEQVHYVEAHGTGTSLGDPIELKALHEILSNGSERPLFVGSVKSNIGHLESAAGIAGLMKAVLALRHREIPGQVHFHQPTPLFDWNRSRLRVTPETIPFPDSAPGVACVSSFGVSGTNAHVVLHEAEAPARQESNVGPDLHLLALSAKSQSALRTLAAHYAKQVASSSGLAFADFCYTVNTGRAQLPVRAALVGTQDEIHSRLVQLAAHESLLPETARIREPRVVFLFNGKGILEPVISRELYEAMPAFREALDRCDEVSRKHFGSPCGFVAFALQYALAELWRSWGIEPASVCGSGGGAVVAACVAGCLSLKDALALSLQHAQSVTASAPVLGLMSSVTGTWVTGAPDAEYWSRQHQEPSRLKAALDLLGQDHHVFIEVGACADLKERNAVRSMLDVLAQAFMSGCTPRFESLHADAPRHKVSVPLYPFERRRYWLETPVASPPLDSSNLHYELEWRRQDLRTENEATRSPAPMFLANDDRDDSDRALSECTRFLEFVQQAVRDSTGIVLVTRGAWQVEETDIVNPAQAALWGMARVLISEQPNLQVTLIDMPESASRSEVDEAVFRELEQSPANEQIAYRKGMRHVARLRNVQQPATRFASAVKDRAYSGTYLVTGGKGGVGRHLVKWLAERGAGRIVILTRHAPSGLTASGHTIDIELGDVSVPADVARAIERCGPNLKGIFHLAGVLDDGTLAQQTPERFERVMAPKVFGAWNLHRESLNRDLDFFVMFSSASGLLGNPGQANYAAANAYLDSLAQMRRGMGLPAHSIQWGPWAGTGMSESSPQRIANAVVAPAVTPMDPRTALAALERVLQFPLPASQMVLAADWAALRSARLPLLQLIVDQLPPVQPERALVDQVRGLLPADACAFLRREVALAAARVLRREKAIGGSDGFFDAGMDSLMALELRNILQSRLGVDASLPSSLLFDYPNSDQLGNHLAEILGVIAPAAAAVPVVPQRTGGPVAIVGMACRFPGGIVNPETYWDALSHGSVAITEIPRDRWDMDAFYDPDPDAPGKMISRSGGFLDQIDHFDAAFFGIAPREAIHMDPQQRLLLEVAWEAMENAGIATDRVTDKSVGVFIGISSNDYLHRLESAVQRGDAYLGAGNALSASAGRLSYVMGWNGPSMAVDTACSSSLVSVHLACQALRDQRCRMAVAGGVNLVLSPEPNVQLTKSRMLSPDGLCKVFDSAADGYVRGEGCGLIVLKRLDDAIADGDRIWAVIRGSAVNQDGRAAGLTVPSGPAQVAVIQEALADAGLKPGEVDYVEAHGTGTSLGDPIELNALAAAYGVHRGEDDLPVGSVKANLGHLESAAGIAGLMKAVLVLQESAVPPQPNFHNPTTHIDWKQSRLRVPVRLLPLRTDPAPHRAAVSSFGFIGTNAHIVLERAPRVVGEPVASASHQFHVLTLSARTAPALETLRQQYLAALSAVPFEDLCFTANTGRACFSHRMALVAANAEEARAQLSDSQGLLRGIVDPDMSVPPVEHVGDELAMFRALAEFFVAGGAVDWSRVYAQGVRRKISIPTYPFQRQRFWPEEAQSQTRRAIPAQPSGHPGHPLLGHRLHSPALSEVVFQSHLSADSPALIKDHLVYEKPVLSGPTQLSMLIDAAQRVFPEGTCVISEVTFLKPNVLTDPDGRTVQVILKVSGDRASFRIVSAASGREEYESEWIAHSTGTLRHEPAETRRVELDNLRRRYESESHMPAGALYDGLRQVGVTLGPAYRWIDEIHYLRGSSLAKMRGSDAAEASLFRIHPGLADSCFQTMAGATGFDEPFAERGEASVPALVSELRIFGSCERASWCHASLQLDHGHSGMTVGAWRLFDDEGKVLAEANGVYLQRAPRESLFRAVAHRASIPSAPDRAVVDWVPETIEAHVQEHVMAVLGLKISQVPGPREKLFDLGLDSLMAMDLKERLEANFGRTLSATLLWDYPTTGALTQYLISMLVGVKPAVIEAAPVVVTDITEIQKMSEKELDEIVRQELQTLLGGEGKL